MQVCYSMKIFSNSMHLLGWLEALIGPVDKTPINIINIGRYNRVSQAIIHESKAFKAWLAISPHFTKSIALHRVVDVNP